MASSILRAGVLFSLIKNLLHFFNGLLQLSGKIRTESGKPGEVVIKASKEENARLIVIGSRGLNAVQRTISGSVSDYVLHNASCPVVICRNMKA